MKPVYRGGWFVSFVVPAARSELELSIEIALMCRGLASAGLYPNSPYSRWHVESSGAGKSTSCSRGGRVCSSLFARASSTGAVESPAARTVRAVSSVLSNSFE
eukprot:Amastigsp_a18372_10.p3 type:complete len:103 gc:universal Amastigsp_a18372_10:407-715(+)